MEKDTAIVIMSILAILFLFYTFTNRKERHPSNEKGRNNDIPNYLGYPNQAPFKEFINPAMLEWQYRTELWHEKNRYANKEKDSLIYILVFLIIGVFLFFSTQGG